MKEDEIWIDDNWISVDNIGRIGLYSRDKQAILLDYSTKWIVGTNENIPCNITEVKQKIIELFKRKEKV